MSTPIIGPPTAPFSTIQQNAMKAGAAGWYLTALQAIWTAGTAVGVDPVVLAAQCALETNWGRFGGVIDGSFGNLAGMKNRISTGDKPEDHAKFAIGTDGVPYVGAVAQAHHLRTYAGIVPPLDTPAPRAVWLIPAKVGSAPNVEDLGGKWAPTLDYGTQIVSIMNKLRTPLKAIR